MPQIAHPPNSAPDSPPAILQIVPSLDTGGAERTTIDIAKALVASGFRALVVSEGGRLESELAEAGGELIRMPMASKMPHTILRNANALAELIRKRNVVVVHARSRAPAWSALIAARRTGIAFVTTYHGIYNARGPLKRWYNSVMARGDAVIANSEWTARHIASTYRFTPKNLTTIPRGLDLRTFDPLRVGSERIQSLRDAWGVKPGDRVVLLPGRLTRWKGQFVLLRALVRLRAEGRLPHALHAVIAGDAQGRDSYARELRDTIAAEGLEDIVVLADHIADMPAAYLAADVVVSASTDPEAFGRVPPEAAAMRRAVIATDHGGARETVLPGETGLLIKPNNHMAMADALSNLLARPPAELAAMGERGRAHVAENFTVERMCAATLAVYRSLIPQHTGTGP
jgi:glycosyltransferase involved in cell wall biosynthesis